MSFISYLINGISLGSLYALIALGYTMVYGKEKMLNFAPFKAMSLRKGSDITKKISRIHFKK